MSFQRVLISLRIKELEIWYFTLSFYSDFWRFMFLWHFGCLEHIIRDRSTETRPFYFIFLILLNLLVTLFIFHTISYRKSDLWLLKFIFLKATLIPLLFYSFYWIYFLSTLFLLMLKICLWKQIEIKWNSTLFFIVLLFQQATRKIANLFPMQILQSFCTFFWNLNYFQ